MSQQIVVLAGGKGSRMASPIPKVLIPLNGRPIIKHLLKQVNVVKQDTPPVIVVGFKSDLVKDELGSDYLYALQKEQNGTAHAVLTAKPRITAKNVIVLCGDMPFITSKSLNSLIDLHHSTESKISMFTGMISHFEGEHEHFSAFGRIIRDENGEITKIREHADASDDEKKITEVNPGVYMFNTEWLWKHMDEIGHGNAQDEFYLTDIIEIAIRDGQKISSLPILPEEMFGINTPVHLEKAKSLISLFSYEKHKV